MSVALVVSALSLVLPSGTSTMAVVQLAVSQRPSATLQSEQPAVFPRSSMLVADSLDDLAAEQQAKDAALAAKKRAFQKAQAEKQAKEQAEYEANLKRVEETKARAEEAKAIQAAKVAAAAEARAAKDAAKGMAQASGKGDSSKSEKYAVQTVNARAERIAARKAAGEEAPTFFGIGQ